jgi:hypothetical protein
LGPIYINAGTEDISLSIGSIVKLSKEGGIVGSKKRGQIEVNLQNKYSKIESS